MGAILEVGSPAAGVSRSGGEKQRPVPLFLMIDSLQTGGSERQFAALAQSIDPSRFTVQTGCLQKKGPFLDLVPGIKEFSLGGSLYGPTAFKTIVRLSRHLRRFQCQIAYAFDFYTNFVLIPAARLARVPVILGSQRQLGDLLSPAKAWAQRRVLGYCDTVVCNSQAAAERLIQQGIAADRLAVIGNGLPQSFFARSTPVLPPSRSKVRVGMIARMNSRSKNHASFLRAAVLVSRKFPDVEFVLAGDGPLRMELLDQAKDLGLHQITFLGDSQDVPAVLASLDISVMPSASESLSNAILESMAAGIPVIASKVGGNGELLASDRGILVTPGDDHGLAQAIERLIRNASLRTEYGARAREFALTQFSMEKIKQEHQELYRKLLRRKTGIAKPHPVPVRSEPCINVAIVAASSRYIGGQSVQAASLISNWTDDPEVRAHFTPIDPAFPKSVKWAELVPFLRTVLREPIYVAQLWKDTKQVDIVHAFAASYWSFLIAAGSAVLVGRLRGKKVLIHYHSGEAADHLERSVAASRIIGSADGIVVPSEYLLNIFSRYGLRAEVVPNTIDCAHFRFRKRNPLRAHFICNRGFHPYYRVDLVVRAFAKIQKQFPSAQLDMIGGGPEETSLRSMVKQLALRNVRFIGPVPQREMPKFYDAADLFINASEVDNMPVSVLEAFASGMPVVSSDAGGIPHIVEDGCTGLLSAVGDYSALAENALSLLKDHELALRISGAAYEWVQSCGWHAVRGRWIEQYRKLLNSGQNDTGEANVA